MRAALRAGTNGVTRPQKAADYSFPSTIVRTDVPFRSETNLVLLVEHFPRDCLTDPSPCRCVWPQQEMTKG